MKKYFREIIIGIGISGIVTFIGIYVKYRERELFYELSNTIRLESEKIRNEIGVERKSRCQLAAALFKSGVDIPTSVLVEFSSQSRLSEPFNNLLTDLSEELSPIEMESQYSSYVNRMEAIGASYPTIAKLDNDKYLLAWCKQKPLYNNGCTGEYIARFSLKDPNNLEKPFELTACGFKSAQDFLSYPEVTTGSVKTMHIKSLMPLFDPNL
jgi:hypothetical protein